jgi:hypothetical protein
MKVIIILQGDDYFLLGIILRNSCYIESHFLRSKTFYRRRKFISIEIAKSIMIQPHKQNHLYIVHYND